MREWIGRPLLDIGYVHTTELKMRLMYSALQARIDAIEEIISEKTYHIEKLRGLLINIPDLVKGLTRIQYGKVGLSSHSRGQQMLTKGATNRSCHHPHQSTESRGRVQIHQRRTFQLGSTQQYP